MKKFHVLLVDDDFFQITVVSEVISSLNHDVQGIIDADEAIRLINENKGTSHAFQIIFIDYNMPVINGVELAQKIKGIDNSLITVAITGEDTPDIRQKILLSGYFDFCLSKNSNITEFKNIFSSIEKI